MSTEPAEGPEPQVLPSSTPEGPQAIPTEGTPEGEPGPDAQQVGFDNRASNPNSGGAEGLSGDMGVSSERTGPEGADPRGMGSGGAAFTGTGSKGGATSRTDGGIDTSPTSNEAPDVSQSGEHAERDDELDDTSGVFDVPGNVDRTVGEPRPNPIEAEREKHSSPDQPGTSRAN
jgi:hypothetical protein